jgi:hypothetical protein
MAKRKIPPARFDIDDWVASGTGTSRQVGRVFEYNSFFGERPRLYGLFIYSPDTEPEFTGMLEGDLEPATPEEIAKYSALAATQEHPRIFRDPQGPRR